MICITPYQKLTRNSPTVYSSETPHPVFKLLITKRYCSFDLFAFWSFAVVTGPAGGLPTSPGRVCPDSQLQTADVDPHKQNQVCKIWVSACVMAESSRNINRRHSFPTNIMIVLRNCFLLPLLWKLCLCALLQPAPTALFDLCGQLTNGCCRRE